MKEIQIRDASTNDIDAMVSLLRQLFAIEADFQFNPESHKKGLLLMLDGCGKHRSIKLALIEGRVVGMCTAQTRISTASGTICAVIEDMVVDDPHRGKGIGPALLSHMDRWAKAHGVQRLQLLADIENRPALDFYQKLGWQQTQLICLTRAPE